MAYFLEMGIVLTIAPWTAFWDRNYFFGLVAPIRSIALASWFRGAVSAMGVVTIVAGLLDLFTVMIRPRPSEPESAGSVS